MERSTIKIRKLFMWHLTNLIESFILNDHFYKKQTKKLLKERKKNDENIL